MDIEEDGRVNGQSELEEKALVDKSRLELGW